MLLLSFSWMELYLAIDETETVSPFNVDGVKVADYEDYVRILKAAIKATKDCLGNELKYMVAT